MTRMRDTRDKILDASLALFSKRGFLGATTKEIAKKAGVAELTLFRHFSSKERLFEEMIARHSFLPALKGLLPELKDLSYEDALVQIAVHFLNRLSERRDLIKIMHSELHLYPAKVKEIQQNLVGEIVRTLASYFGGMQEAGLLKEFDPELGARAFLGMFFQYFTNQEFVVEKKQKFENRDVVIREYVNIFVFGTADIGSNNGSDSTDKGAVMSVRRRRAAALP
jgi:AcrR family transcriptional regulator